MVKDYELREALRDVAKEMHEYNTNPTPPFSRLPVITPPAKAPSRAEVIARKVVTSMEAVTGGICIPPKVHTIPVFVKLAAK